MPSKILQRLLEIKEAEPTNQSKKQFINSKVVAQMKRNSNQILLDIKNIYKFKDIMDFSSIARH